MQQRNPEVVEEKKKKKSPESRQHYSRSLGPWPDKRSQSSPLDSHLTPTVVQDTWACFGFPDQQRQGLQGRILRGFIFLTRNAAVYISHIFHPCPPHCKAAKATHNSPWLTCSQILISISSARRKFPRKNSCQRECPDGALRTFSSRDCLASPPAQPQNGSLALPVSPAPLGVVLGTLCTRLWQPDLCTESPARRSPALRKVCFATACSKARDPAAVPRYIHHALQLWKYLKEWLWAGQCGRGRTGPASLSKNTATTGCGMVMKVSSKKV